MLYLAKNIQPVLASIIMVGIYTTSVPLLWSVSSRFTKDGSIQFKELTIVLTLTGMVIGLYLPFDKLVNIVYVINGSKSRTFDLFQSYQGLALCRTETPS